ncbi:MAG: hypothetical protein LAO56_07035 [Acidobacteriia bacterium]|nr:hypothetical protein [Terriglobia bacterium]
MFQAKKIRSLKPNVSREQAIQHFSAGVLNLVANLTRGGVRSIAELYIPYRTFRVTITSGGRVQSRIFALDAVEGILDLFEFPAHPAESDLLTIETRNVLPPSLDGSDLRDRIIAKVRRIVFAQGFFKLRDLQIEAEVIPGDYCVPYWVCFRGVSGVAHLAVLDAVRRKREGAKVRHMIEEWLRSDRDSPGGSRGL